jgi:hypothetical protein
VLHHDLEDSKSLQLRKMKAISHRPPLTSMCTRETVQSSQVAVQNNSPNDNEGRKQITRERFPIVGRLVEEASINHRLRVIIGLM